MTEAQLTDLEKRISKGWVVRPDQILALIRTVRQHNHAAIAGQLAATKTIQAGWDMQP